MSVHTPYQKHTWVTKEIIRREYLQNIEDGIYQEQQDAEAAETALENALAAEEQRARSSETTIQNNLTAEVTRATAAENEITQSIQDDLDDLSERISNEYTRATTAESNLSTSLQAEVTRATNAEADLRSTLTRAYKAAGSILFAALPAPSASYLGFVYDITDAFTTTSDFVEGAGKDYPAGTNVGIVDVGTTSSPSYKYDAMPGFLDTSTFVEKTDYASTSAFGVVKVDGTTITSNNGVISSTGGGGSSDAYKTSDTASTTVNDTDYVPMSETGGTRKNVLWSTLKTVLENTFATLTKLTDGSVTKVGTSTVGSSSRPIYLNNGTPTQVSADKVLFFSGQACSATTGNFCTISNSAITVDHVVAECVFSKSSTITTDVTCTTANGSLTLNGTCTDATCTVTITLVKKDN